MYNQKFITSFEKKVKETISKYRLCSKKEKVIVACSGGKDSTTVLYLMNKFGYKVEGMVIDLMIGKWSKDNLENIGRFCKEQRIKLHVIDLRKVFGSSMCFIRSKVQAKHKLSNCMVCGVIKRWLINKKARELKGKKLATGHNLDDEAETVLMNLLKGNLKIGLNSGPKTGKVIDKKFVPRIKPLYFCLNEEVKKYSKLMKFQVLYEPCPCRVESFRVKVRKELNKKEREEPKIKENIVKSFLKILPALRKEYKTKEKVNYCKICKEPSRGEFCKMCRLLEK
jgi:uncharacterized protein (TIGR00269 family)